MVKKSSEDDIKVRNFDELNNILKNSFSGIKRDMGSVKESLYLLQNYITDTKKDLLESKKDFVTIDKLNALKIKLADINESVKKLDLIEASLKKTDERLAGVAKLEADLKKLRELSNDLKNQVSLAERISKGAVTETKLRQLAKEVSAEINEMNKRLELYSEKGGDVVERVSDDLKEDVKENLEEQSKRFDGLADELKEEIKNFIESGKKESTRKMLKLLEGINKVREEQNRLVNRNQVNDVLRSVNSEFDSVKERINDLSMLKKDIKLVRRDKVSKNNFDQQAKDVNGKFADIEKDIETLKAKVSGAKSKKERRFSILTIANIFIVLAFILLGVSFAQYFLDRTGFMNYVIIAAVALFIIGIIIRVVSVLRG